MTFSKSVLSIQSHVSHGYVGGKAAIFPLQTQGWEVDNVNTVNFSNHTGYGSFKGSAIDTKELENIFDGLNDIDMTYNAVISGYIPNDSLIETVKRYIQKLKAKVPKLVYLLDPVMGDQGYIYVDESCVHEYRRMLASGMVDIITPNQFELELLCDLKICSEEDLKAAIHSLHLKYGIKYVVVTSLDENLCLSKKPHSNKGIIYCAISCATETDIHVYSIPIIRSYFTGVGDMFSALLLDKLYNNLKTRGHGLDALSKSVNQVLTIMLNTLKLTHKLGIESYYKSKGMPVSYDTNLEGKINDGSSMKFFELKVIESKNFYDYADDGIFTPDII
ncbi:uncharacterized protein PRCAT00002168001 [Priceomyces carsonii]|uniref:uncharacterized protein n=1 Tax=Priceomyces carsonii TaxID=28549 RepID=UPI002ED7A5B0|nr:unnamed protein product [Priceomyces carsonii]